MISRSNKINRSGRIFAIISVLLLMLMFVSAFCSCNNNKVPGPDTSSGESSENPNRNNLPDNIKNNDSHRVTDR